MPAVERSGDLSEKLFYSRKRTEYAGKYRRVYAREILQCRVYKRYDVVGENIPGKNTDGYRDAESGLIFITDLCA